MERWGVRERVCAVELFIWTGSITKTQRGFRRERNQQVAPSPNAIRRWVRQWREEGSVACKKPLGRPSSVRTPDNIARVLASVSRSPRRSARKRAQALRMSDRSVRHTLRSDLSLHPYKLQVVHALSNRDREMRLQFCRQFVGILTENLYSNRPNAQRKHREEIAKLSGETLQAVMRSFLTRLQLCIEEGGGHLKDIVHKK